MRWQLLAVTVAAVAALPAFSRTETPALVLDHVNVIPMTGDEPQVENDVSVVITQGVIRAVGKSTAAPRTARHIDGRGAWLIPGLTDSHMHLENERMAKLYFAMLHADLPTRTNTADSVLPYVANGVLQVVDLSAMTETLAQKSEIESGKVLGPHIVTAQMIDGNPPLWPPGMTEVATTPEEGRQKVRAAADAGYDLIKAYSNLDLPTFTAIVDEARKHHLPVVGHIPGRNHQTTAQYFLPGFEMVAHAEEFAQQTREPDESAIPQYVAMARNNGTGLIATLTLDQRLLEEVRDPASLKSRPEMAYLAPSLRALTLAHNPYVARASDGFRTALEKVVAFDDRLVKAFSEARIPVLAGTDSLVPGVVPGFALQDELAALVRAGLSPYQALTAATRAPCAWLHKACGTVTQGARADLVLLDADPLADIANTSRIRGVVLSGRYVDRAALDAAMADLRRRNLDAAIP